CARNPRRSGARTRAPAGAGGRWAARHRPGEADAEVSKSADGCDMSLLLADVPDLPAELERLLAQIPAGRVTTYGDLARALGDVKAARWVGEYLLEHPHPDACTCHRVVRKEGEVGLYIAGDPAEKVSRL